MNVFLAWSGPVSHSVAEALHKWLPSVLQKLKPFMSSADIDKGARWRNELAKQVEGAAFAILCLTPDNLESTWIHFEAGAVSRQATEGRVTALLVGVKPEQVVDPLAQFQNTPATEVDVKKLVVTLNALLDSDKLTDARLDDAFETYWPRLEIAITEAQAQGTGKAPPARSTDDMLAEILANSRDQGRSLAGLAQDIRRLRPLRWVRRRAAGGILSSGLGVSALEKAAAESTLDPFLADPLDDSAHPPLDDSAEKPPRP